MVEKWSKMTTKNHKKKINKNHWFRGTFCATGTFWFRRTFWWFCGTRTLTEPKSRVPRNQNLDGTQIQTFVGTGTFGGTKLSSVCTCEERGGIDEVCAGTRTFDGTEAEFRATRTFDGTKSRVPPEPTRTCDGTEIWFRGIRTCDQTKSRAPRNQNHFRRTNQSSGSV